MRGSSVRIRLRAPHKNPPRFTIGSVDKDVREYSVDAIYAVFPTKRFVAGMELQCAHLPHKQESTGSQLPAPLPSFKFRVSEMPRTGS